MSFRQQHLYFQLLVVPQDLYLNFFPSLMCAKRISEIVQVLNRVRAELNEDIARL